MQGAQFNNESYFVTFLLYISGLYAGFTNPLIRLGQTPWERKLNRTSVHNGGLYAQSLSQIQVCGDFAGSRGEVRD